MILEIFKQVKHSRPCGLKAICGSSNNETFPFLDSYFLKTYAKKYFLKIKDLLPCVLILLASNFMLSTFISCNIDPGLSLLNT